jgi:hypothetical protein
VPVVSIPDQANGAHDHEHDADKLDPDVARGGQRNVAGVEDRRSWHPSSPVRPASRIVDGPWAVSDDRRSYDGEDETTNEANCDHGAAILVSAVDAECLSSQA